MLEGKEFKRIAIHLAKSVYQVPESVRFGQVTQWWSLSREAFIRYIQQQWSPVEWLMVACGYCWGRVRVIHAWRRIWGVKWCASWRHRQHRSVGPQYLRSCLWICVPRLTLSS